MSRRTANSVSAFLGSFKVLWCILIIAYGQVKELHGSAEQLSREKIRLEADKEVEEESIVNRLQRQIESLIQNYKVQAYFLKAFSSTWDAGSSKA